MINQRKKSLTRSVFFVLMLCLSFLAVLPQLHAEGEPKISLTYGSDSHGSVTEWMLKCDATRDGIVNTDDYDRIIQIANNVYVPNELEEESADLAIFGSINSVDFTIALELVNDHLTLPDAKFTFRVVDTPVEGYAVYGANITTNEGTIPLTIHNPTSGNYSLTVDENGVGTVTGQSLATNDVQFTHRLIESPEPATVGLEVPVVKALTGDTPDAPTVFTFNIVPNEETPNAPTPEIGTCTVSGAGDTAFGEITFTEVGRYYYDITETAGTNNEYTYDDSVYTICVEVINAENGGFSASIVATWKDEDAEKPGEVIFTNSYSATPGSLTLSKTVTGELGDHNLGFTFSVEFDDETYNFDGGEYGSITNGVGTITLKHNESITFTDVPANTTYTITETNGESYTTTINNNRSTVDGKVATGTVRRLATVNVSYTNDLPYIPVVGLNMNVIPFIALGIFGLGCFSLIVIKRRFNICERKNYKF